MALHGLLERKTGRVMTTAELMAQLTGLISFIFLGLMILIELLGYGIQATPFPFYVALLFGVWSIGWTIRDAMEKKTP